MMLENIMPVMVSVLAGVALSWVLPVLRKLLQKKTTKLRLGPETEVTVDLSDIKGSVAKLTSLSGHPRAFIAFSHEDEGFAQYLTRELEDRGVRCWLSSREMRVGDSIAQTLEEGIRGSGYFLVIISQAFNESRWAMKELDLAVESQRRHSWPRVIPVVVEDADVPPPLRGKLYVDFRANPNEAVNRIVDSIREEASTALRHSLKDSDANYLKYVLQASEASAPEAHSVVSTLVGGSAHHDIGFLNAALKALGEIKSERAVEPLIRILKDEDSSVRRGAAKVLGEIKSESAVEPLIRILKDEDSSVRCGAAKALEEITKKHLRGDYEIWQEWWQQSKGINGKRR